MSRFKRGKRRHSPGKKPARKPIANLQTLKDRVVASGVCPNGDRLADVYNK